MELQQDEREQARLAGRYLTFSLAKERYGLEILKVQEIIGVPNITCVPRCPAFIKGVINLRGRIVPIIDLRLKFGLVEVPYTPKSCVVVVNINAGDQVISLGVIVDTVLEVLDFKPAEIETAPNYGVQVKSNFIVGMGRKNGGDLNILIDIERAVSSAEVGALMQVTK
ncbi:MAG: chemotaxis protein CheW [Oligoflexia bacterium]|nr:chemotaxis protein CheW [Oligoflexia bacterium]